MKIVQKCTGDTFLYQLAVKNFKFCRKILQFVSVCFIMCYDIFLFIVLNYFTLLYTRAHAHTCTCVYSPLHYYIYARMRTYARVYALGTIVDVCIRHGIHLNHIYDSSNSNQLLHNQKIRRW
jgi:hypothetical protein